MVRLSNQMKTLITTDSEGMPAIAFEAKDGTKTVPITLFTQTENGENHVSIDLEKEIRAVVNTLQGGIKTESTINNAKGAKSITPNNTGTLDATAGLFIGVAGDLKVDMVNGDTVTFKGLAAGVIHPISCTRVYATGTTALEIVGVY